MCVVGFEPNPHHTAKLQDLETVYQAKGWRVKTFTETAPSLQDGTDDFDFLDTLASPERHEWGSSMVAWQDMKESKEAGNSGNDDKTTVRTMDLAKYVLEHVAPRQVPAVDSTDMAAAAKGVLMKLDIKMDVEISD